MRNNLREVGPVRPADPLRTDSQRHTPLASRLVPLTTPRLAGLVLLALVTLLAAGARAADLPVKDGLVVWLKADSVNPSDTTEVRTSGSDVFVKLWKDQSPGTNPHNASNTTDTDQPLYVPNALNGHAVLRFVQNSGSEDDGDRLYLGDLGLYSANAGTFFAVATLNNNDGRYNLFGNRNGNDERWVANTWSESHPGIFRNTRASGSFTQGAWPTYGSHVFFFESSRTVYRGGVDGGDIGSDTPDYHSGAGANWTIANRVTSGQQLDGDIAEIIVYNHTLTPEEANQVGYYLSTKYALATIYTDGPAPAPQAKIYDLGLPGNPAIIDEVAGTITLTVPFRTDVKSLAPTFLLSAGATCNKVSGAPQNFTTPQTYTVTSSDHALTASYVVTVIVRPPSVAYDFDNGLQGWTQIWPSPSGTAVLWANGALGSGNDQDDPYSRFARSPAFVLHGLEDLTFQLRGGQSPLAAPAAPSAIPEMAINGGGFAGVALREVATGTYLLWARRNGSADAWLTGRFTTNDLAPFVGKKCTLDYMDYNMGGWGWTYMDNVSIPGYGTQLNLEAADATISLGMPGATTTAVLKIPEGFNQHNAVTVYLTNGNPSVLTVNGSTAATLTLTFAAGGPNATNLTLVGTAVGTPRLTAHTTSLDDASLTISVVPALLGRWFNGAADLTDSAGFRPAGTHDGVAVGTAAALAFTAEVPPGCTGQALDLRTGNVGVMVNNSASTDAGYLNTFDDLIRSKFTVAFWAKGFPGSWNPWLSKRGESGMGWQVRRMSGDPVAGFTIRGIDSEDGWGSAINVNDTSWHHFVAVWNQAAGTRTLYIDGVLSHVLNNTVGQVMGLASGKHLVLGGREQAGSGFEGYFPGLLYDVRLFSYPLTQADARALIPPAIRLAGRSAVMVGASTPLTVTIPTGANASSAVTVQLTNAQPGRLTIDGSAATVVPVVFAAGAANSKVVTLAGVSLGLDTLTAAAPGLATASLLVEVHAPGAPGLIGRWLDGAPHLADVSGFTAGTHDGSFVGAPPTGNFTNDLPLGLSGSALDLRGTPNLGVRINNTRLGDAAYQPTFDDNISSKFTVAFWAKGFPDSWNAWVAKFGEGQGWQLRRWDGNPYACFTVRGQPNEDGTGSTINVNDSNWHHYLGVWDGETGERSLYVDGVLSHTITGGYAPMTQSPGAHLTLGARADASDNYGSWFKGLLYDVRLYNTALTADDALNLVGAILTAPQSFSLLSPSPNTNFVAITVPPSAVAAADVVIKITSDKPSVAIPEGAVGGVLTLTLPRGGANTTTFAIQANGPGTAHFTYQSAQLPSAGVTTIAVQQPNIGGLVAYWNFDNQTLAETSGFQPAGTHDGAAVGTVGYVPGRLGGYAADLRALNSAVRVQNSQITDPNYRPTFDAFLFNSAAGFTWTLWVKGLPASDWASWLAKDGESAGYAIRKAGGSQVTFTLRNSDGVDDPTSAGASITDQVWHHLAAVYDPVAQQRHLYVDGVEQTTITDGNLITPATGMPLCFGSRDAAGDARFARVIVDEIRAYDRVLTVDEITAQVGAPMIAITPNTMAMNLGDPDIAATITVPPSMIATSAVSVTVTSTAPAVAALAGATAGSLTVNFAKDGPNTATVWVHGAGLGTATLRGISPQGIINGEINVTVLRPVVLVGHWLTGTPDLVDSAGYRPAGTHDGVAVGANASFLTYSDDVPPGFTGQSLDLTAGTVGVMIRNSSYVDTGYLPTFDTEIATNFTIAFWAKGMPGEWRGWVTKYGENGKGWQVRRMANDNVAGFTIRGLDNDDGTGSGINVNNANWHHFVGIWDQASATRRLYVDGVLSHILSNNPAQVMSQAPGAHLVFGGLQDEGGTYWDRWASCLLFDVRIYKYSLSDSRIQALLTLPVDLPPLAVQPWTDHQIRIAWPSAFTGFTLEQSASVPGGWTPSALPVTLEGSENVVYAPVTTGMQFFRLVK